MCVAEAEASQPTWDLVRLFFLLPSLFLLDTGYLSPFQVGHTHMLVVRALDWGCIRRRARGKLLHLETRILMTYSRSFALETVMRCGRDLKWLQAA